MQQINLRNSHMSITLLAICVVLIYILTRESYQLKNDNKRKYKVKSSVEILETIIQNQFKSREKSLQKREETKLRDLLNATGSFFGGGVMQHAKDTTNNNPSPTPDTAERKSAIERLERVLNKNLENQKSAQKKIEEKLHQLEERTNQTHNIKEPVVTYLSTPLTTPKPQPCPHKKHKPSRYILMENVKVNNCGTQYRLVIMISSHEKHFKRREVIRRTWANHTLWNIPPSLPWTVIFNVGIENGTTEPSEEIVAEANMYNDIIVGNVVESFYTLSRKLSISIDWLFRNLRFDFFMKTDDDVFVNVRSLLELFPTLPKHVIYLGYVMWRQPPERSGRYKLTHEEFKHDYFDPYCSGGGIVARREVIKRIFPKLVFENPLKFEDAYFGSLANKARIVPSFGYNPRFRMDNTKCLHKPDTLVSHPAKKKKCMFYLMESTIGKKIEHQEIEDSIHAIIENEN